MTHSFKLLLNKTIKKNNLQEKQTEGERFKAKICKENGGAEGSATWGQGQGGDRQRGRKKGQLSLTFVSVSGIQSAKLDLKPLVLLETSW